MAYVPRILYNAPNLLSAYRIVSIPLITLFFYLGRHGVMDDAVATWINVVIFFFACVSDWLDGEIARSTGQTTIFGKFLDSTSDKILVGGVLMLLVAFGRLTDYWVIAALIIFVRELIVAGLREFLGLYNISVPISRMGKWKAAVQMLGSGFLMAGPEYGPKLIPHAFEFGQAVFLIATCMTVVSGWDYIKAGLVTIRKLDAGEKP